MNAEIGTPGLLKKIHSQSVVYALSNVGVAAIGFLALPVLSWILGLEVYGQYVIVYQIIYVFGTLISGWATTAYLRYYPESIEKNKLLGTYLTGIITGSILFLIPAMYLSKKLLANNGAVDALHNIGGLS